METIEPLIQRGPPPHPHNQKKGSPFTRILTHATLFLIILILAIHFPDFTPNKQSREQIIEEIQGVLEKHSKDLSEGTSRELAKVIYEESINYNHDPKFILALIAIESSFQNRSVSEQGAKGLMQLMPYVAESIAKELGIEWKGDLTLFNPFLNIRMGIHYLSQLILDFDDIGVALTAYNYGPTYVRGLVERKERIPGYFSKRVFTAYQTL